MNALTGLRRANKWLTGLLFTADCIEGDAMSVHEQKPYTVRYDWPSGGYSTSDVEEHLRSFLKNTGLSWSVGYVSYRDETLGRVVSEPVTVTIQYRPGGFRRKRSVGHAVTPC